MRTLLVVLLSCTICKAQKLDDFVFVDKQYGNDAYVDLVASYSISRNPKAPNPDGHHVQGFTGKLSLRSVHFDVGEQKTLYQHKLLFDLILIIDSHLAGNDKALARQEGSGLTTGIIGWYSTGWNVFKTDRLSGAIGVNLNDYFLTNSYRLDFPKDDLTSIEPQGYWFAAGPSVFLDVGLNKYFLLHTHAFYSMSYWRAASLSYAERNDHYPKPHFGNFSFEVQSKWALFAGMDYSWLINRGNNPNNTKRLDFLLGFRLPL